MKTLLIPALCIFTLTLSGCSILGAAATLATSMLQAVGRTVTQADTPGGESGIESGIEAVAQRGSEIEAKGTFGGAETAAPVNPAGTVARR